MIKSVAIVAGLALAATAQAQYSTDFEAPLYAGSAAGNLLTGQDGWYLPAVAGSQDGTVHTYANNAFGFVTNPTGGAQFAVTRFGAANPARGQHAFAFNGNTTYTAAYDFCADRFGGSLPASNNLGSFSLQPSATNRFFQSLMIWDDLNTGNAMDANYIFFDAAGVQNGASGITPGAAWNALNLNTWYRMSTTFNMATNQILAVSIDNLHDAAAATVLDTSAMGWYLSGGTAPTQALPTDFRIFGSGAGTNGNQVGWDNLSITAVPTPGVMALLGISGVIASRRRRA